MKDKLSTLLDGSLDEESMAAMFDLLKRDPSARREWDTWCLIGDVLRGEQGGSPDFVARVMDAVEREPVVFAPARAAASEARRSVWRAMLPVAAGSALSYVLSMRLIRQGLSMEASIGLMPGGRGEIPTDRFGQPL